MAVRPIFVPCLSGSLLVQTYHIDFKWHSGMAKSQSQKSISELHGEAKKIIGIERILEISSKSADEYGVALSAFNLMIKTVKRER